MRVPRSFYCLRYLYHVARGFHGRLTWREIAGDMCSIWEATP